MSNFSLFVVCHIVLACMKLEMLIVWGCTKLYIWNKDFTWMTFFVEVFREPLRTLYWMRYTIVDFVHSHKDFRHWYVHCSCTWESLVSTFLIVICGPTSCLTLEQVWIVLCGSNNVNCIFPEEPTLKHWFSKGSWSICTWSEAYNRYLTFL